MARPRSNAPADQFTSTEMAVAGGMTPRNFALLLDRGLAPEPSTQPGVRSGPRFWDSFGVSHVALIGAFNRCGVELLLSAKLAEGYARETGSAYGHLPSRLSTYLQPPLNPRRGEPPWEYRADDEKIRSSLNDDFWLHHFLRTRSKIYRVGEALRGDAILEVVDRQYVFMNILGDRKGKFFSFSSLAEPEPTCRVVGWDRNSDAHIMLFMEELNMSFHDPRFKEASADLERKYIEARNNAMGILRVNASLAIRNAFDAIHDHRVTARTSLDFTTSAKGLPSRYDGCFPDGSPLDPEHPWNKDLPPLERAQRLLKIEKYLAKLEGHNGDEDQ